MQNLWFLQVVYSVSWQQVSFMTGASQSQTLSQY
jgi:hypothetical protein